jgi:hypothetical protein
MEIDMNRQVHPLRVAKVSDIFPSLRPFVKPEVKKGKKFKNNLQNFLNKDP